MKIISLTSENIKRLTAVEIRPDGNLVQITGKNGQGKTSVLDSIWWALAGASHIQSVPIRQGATEARICLDMGEIIVTRTFSAKDDGPTTRITVENAGGARYPSPQKMLDGLVGALSFDPLAFTRMDRREQFETLRQFVPGVDFDAIDAANKVDFARRTEINRSAKVAAAAAERIDVPADLPDEPIDEAALLASMQAAAEQNADIERRLAARAQAREKIAANRQAIEELSSIVNNEIVKVSARISAEIAELEKQIARARERETAEIAALRADGKTRGDALVAEADALQTKLDAAPALPDLVGLDDIRVGIERAKRVNAGIADRNRRDAFLAEACELEAQSKALTDAMAQRTAERDAAIASAKLPVPGLGFGDGAVLLDGLPFDQASDAQQLRVGVAIAMATNPKLRVIRVRDGSLLDEDALTLLAQLADEHDCQVWLERVDSTGKVGFVLEDGHVRAPQVAEAAE